MEKHYLGKLLLVLVLLFSVANISITTLLLMDREQGSEIATQDSPITETEKVYIDPVSESEVPDIDLLGKTLSNNAFSLTVPDGLYVSYSSSSSNDTVRIQNYSPENDRMSQGEFFLYVFASNSDNDMATFYKKTEQGKFFSTDGIKGEGDGFSSISTGDFSRGYYFPHHVLGITIFANDAAGLAAAEDAVKNLNLR